MVILVNVSCAFGKAVYFCSFFIQSFIMSVRPSWMIVLSTLFVLIFLLILSVTERRTMKSPTAITDLSIFPSCILKLYWNANVVWLLCHLGNQTSLSLRRISLYFWWYSLVYQVGTCSEMTPPQLGETSSLGPGLFPITAPRVEGL